MNAARFVLLLLAVALAVSACDRSPEPKAPSGEETKIAISAMADKTKNAGQSLVVYCSADAVYFQPVLDAFTARTGIKVDAVFDTEATKTFGLVQRLINEKDRPQADAFVSSEALGMIRLDRAGVLTAFMSGPAEAAFDRVGGWPETLRAKGRTWYGFARRARVLVYNTKLVKPEEIPKCLADLTDARWKGRAGMARPQFGTTRGHISALHMACPDAFRPWLVKLKANDLRLYDGNSAVVRAVANGEIHVGLTDNDDVAAGLANGWPVAMEEIHNRIADVCEPKDKEPPSQDFLRFPDTALFSPHTVGVIRGGPHAGAVGAFVDFVLSEEADGILASGDAHTSRIYGDWLKKERPFDAPDQKSGEVRPEMYNAPDLESIADHTEPALAEFGRVFGE